MRSRRLAGAAGALLLAACAGCGPSIRSAHEAPEDPCEIVRGGSTSEDTLTVVVTDSITTHAPLARNPAERLLFDLLYRTLLTVDCSNELRPGLAERWDRRDGLWTFRLRADARFADGTAVTAADVVAGLRFSGEPFDSAFAVDDRTLEVRFVRPLPDARIFAGPGFAVMKMGDPFGLWVGAGPYRTDDDVTRGDLILRPAHGANDPTIRLVMALKRDVRDMLARGVDLVITDTPELIEYAAAQPGFVATALAWDRTYVLLAPSRVRALREGRALAGLPRSFTDALAKDAVRAQARGAAAPAWWGAGAECFEEWDLSAHTALSRNPRRIVFDAHDATARDLAERLVAVAAMDPRESALAEAMASAVPGLVGGSPELIAVGLEPGRMESGMGFASDVAYVVALPHAVPDACTAARQLASRVPWLVPHEVVLADALLPLVDTRPHAIVAQGRVGLALSGLGGVILETAVGSGERLP
jgi:hypothetical protein